MNQEHNTTEQIKNDDQPFEKDTPSSLSSLATSTRGTSESRTFLIAYQAVALCVGMFGLHNLLAGFFVRAICQFLLTAVGIVLLLTNENVFPMAFILILISRIWSLFEIFIQRKDAYGLPMRKCGCLAQIGIVVAVFMLVGLLSSILQEFFPF